MVVFEPLAASSDGIYQNLLTLDEGGARILIDIGWNASLNASLDDLISITESIDLILLTHPTISHLGAYCYLCKKFPEFAKIPVYATTPVVNLGRVVILDSYRSKGLTGPFRNPFISTIEVEECFDRIKSVKYSQPVSLGALGNSKLEDVSITAYNSGHSLGGTMWKITYDVESILYSVDWNHSRDNVLNGAFLESNGKVNEQLVKPSVMITSSTISSGKPAKQTRADLLDNIKLTLNKNGTVLIPTSSGSRVLDLLLVLDKHFTDEKIEVPLLFLSYMGQRTLSYASSMLEWMLSSIIDRWQVKNESPFDINRIKFITSIEQLQTYKGTSKVIITTDESLESGLSRQGFAEVAQSPESSIILTELCPPRTLGKLVHDLWAAKTGKSQKLTKISETIPSLEMTKEVPLQGEELAAYNREREDEKREKDLELALEKRNKEILEKDEEDAFSSDDDDDQIVSGQMDLGILVYGDGVYDFDLLNESSQKVRMFPYITKRVRKDDYGELLKPGQFEKLAKPSAVSYDGAMQRSQNPGEEEDLDEIDADDATLGQSRNWREDTRKSSEPPLELVKYEIELKLNCSVNYIDFSGLTDMRSIRMILPQIQPSHLIVLEGNSDASKVFQSLGIPTDIATGPITIQQLGFSMNVKLSEEIENLLDWQQILDRYTVSHVTGKLSFELSGEESNEIDGERLIKRPRTAVLEILEGAQSHKKEPIFVGDIRLTQLKQKLSQDGYNAEFRGQGVLVCNNRVSVRKVSEGHFVIDGGLEPEFYVVRKAIKSFLATV